jgi:hypothetical protein
MEATFAFMKFYNVPPNRAPSPTRDLLLRGAHSHDAMVLRHMLEFVYDCDHGYSYKETQLFNDRHRTKGRLSGLVGAISQLFEAASGQAEYVEGMDIKELPWQGAEFLEYAFTVKDLVLLHDYVDGGPGAVSHEVFVRSMLLWRAFVLGELGGEQYAEHTIDLEVD